MDEPGILPPYKSVIKTWPYSTSKRDTELYVVMPTPGTVRSVTAAVGSEAIQSIYYNPTGARLDVSMDGQTWNFVGTLRGSDSMLPELSTAVTFPMYRNVRYLRFSAQPIGNAVLKWAAGSITYSPITMPAFGEAPGGIFEENPALAIAVGFGAVIGTLWIANHLARRR